MNRLPIRRLIRFCEITFLLLAGLAGAFLLFSLLPIEGNYKLLVVQSGSMEPTVPLGSLVMVLPQEEYRVGEIVTFAPSDKEKDKYVTHRIIGFASDTFGLLYQTKGDANKTPDAGSLAKEKIVGQVLFTVPYVGWLFAQMKTPLGFILAVVVPATVVIYEEIKKIYQSLREGLLHFSKKKSQQKQLSLGKDELNLLKSINQLRREHHISFDSRFPLFLLFFGVSFAFVGMTQSFFSDIEIGSVTLAAAEGSPSPTASPSPSPDHIVLNEVYYDVDKKHGLDSPGDRGVTVGKHVTKNRHKSGPAGQNDTFIDIETLCNVVQNNQTDVDVDIDVSGNTGNNTAFGNLLGSTSIESGDVASAVVIDIQGGSNTLLGFCIGGKSRNHEWIELYNPTSQTVNLKDWTITDNSGIVVKIPGNRNLGPGKFALISKSNSTWIFWDEPQQTLKIPLGRQIGDGLDDEGDRLILKDKDSNEIDAMSYGDDTSEFSLGGVVEGHSLERHPDGKDTDMAGDWVDRFPPQPGM